MAQCGSESSTGFERDLHHSYTVHEDEDRSTKGLNIGQFLNLPAAIIRQSVGQGDSTSF